mgnify:CR=1 FL=1
MPKSPSHPSSFHYRCSRDSISIHCHRYHQLYDVNDHKCQRKIIIIICWCNFNYGLCWCQLKQRHSEASSREYFMSILIYYSHYFYHHKHNDDYILISILHKISSSHNNYYCKLAHYFNPSSAPSYIDPVIKFFSLIIHSYFMLTFSSRGCL